MNAVRHNRKIFESTGLTIANLPDEYVRNHPRNIEIKLKSNQKSRMICTEKNVTFPVEFRFPVTKEGKWKGDRPEWMGEFFIDLQYHPKNRYLVELVKYLAEDDAELCLYGRQYESRFHVTNFYPKKWENKAEFTYLLSEMGIYYECPLDKKDETDVQPMFFDSKENCELFYKIFRDHYPLDIRRYIEKHMHDYSYSEDVKRFIQMDWRAPKLQLPSVQEARRILDTTVYGMNEVKERLLEFLQSVRNSKNFAYNLLLVGPPGTGKTTIMQAIAKMFKLPMSVVPMSSCQDVEAFVGFAHTYMNSQEGLLTTALLSPVLEMEDGTKESIHQIGQVLFLNELDKCNPGNGKKGATQTALLRILDDNRSFFDVNHEMNIPLSHVIIVADANDISQIQKPLLDRFEVIEIPPYNEQEKQYIFRHFTFPKALKAQKVDPSRIAVTEEAINCIVSRCQAPGVREQRRIADRIVKNYLLHFADCKSKVCYTQGMVEPFLPKLDVRQSYFISKPGIIQSAVLFDGVVQEVSVQCAVERAKSLNVQVFGTDDLLLRQELEAAAICACRQIIFPCFDVKIQICGLPKEADACGQLGFPVFMGIISAYYHHELNGIYYGGATLLGGLTSNTCDSPDALLSYADKRNAETVYTAKGFTERLTQPHKTPVIEFANSEVAKMLLFGSGEFMAI